MNCLKQASETNAERHHNSRNRNGGLRMTADDSILQAMRRRGPVTKDQLIADLTRSLDRLGREAMAGFVSARFDSLAESGRIHAVGTSAPGIEMWEVVA